MAGPSDASQSQGYSTVVGFGPSRRVAGSKPNSWENAPGSGYTAPGAAHETPKLQGHGGEMATSPTSLTPPLDSLADANWLQEEKKRMDAYTVAQLGKLEEQRRILLQHQLEVERDLILKRQELNQQVYLISSRVAALQKREQALNEREAALAAQSERLRNSQQELLTLFQSRVQAPAEQSTTEAPPREERDNAPQKIAAAVPPEPAAPAAEPESRVLSEKNQDAAPPAPPGEKTSAPSPEVKSSNPAATLADSKGTSGKPVAGLRFGNPVSVLVFSADEAAEPSPSWVIARSAHELHLRADDAVEVGTVLRVRPTKAPARFAGVSVKVVSCRQEKNQWILGCRMLQKLSGAFLQLFG